MAFTRLAINGNGQIELNNVAFRRDGRIEAQCKLSVAAENGMILAVDTAKREVRLPKAEGEDCPLAVVYDLHNRHRRLFPAYSKLWLPAGLHPKPDRKSTCIGFRGQRHRLHCHRYHQ